MVVTCELLVRPAASGVSQQKRRLRTGEGRCNRDAANFSAGASNATTGAPNVTPIREASEPPRECPV